MKANQQMITMISTEQKMKNHLMCDKSINITWMSISTGKILASITAWICWRFPAVMFEMVQHA